MAKPTDEGFEIQPGGDMGRGVIGKSFQEMESAGVEPILAGNLKTNEANKK